jgi:hypothetical protein
MPSSRAATQEGHQKDTHASREESENQKGVF